LSRSPLRPLSRRATDVPRCVHRPHPHSQNEFHTCSRTGTYTTYYQGYLYPNVYQGDHIFQAAMRGNRCSALVGIRKQGSFIMYRPGSFHLPARPARLPLLVLLAPREILSQRESRSAAEKRRKMSSKKKGVRRGRREGGGELPHRTVCRTSPCECACPPRTSY